MTFSSLVGERLREARKDLGLNQAEIAELAGVSREYWGRMERGASVPGGEVLAALALRGADVTYILTGQRSGEAVPAAPALTPRQQALLDNYEHTDEAGKKIIEGTASLAAQSAGKVGRKRAA